MERRKNISHLMTSDTMLPGPAYPISTPKNLLPQRSHNSLIKSICSDCINTQQINSRKQRKQSQLNQDILRVKEMQAQDQRRRVQEQEKRQTFKSQLSVDLRGLIENQEKEKKNAIEREKRQNQKIRSFYQNQERKIRGMEEQRNRSINAIRMQLKNGLDQQIQEKSKQKVKPVNNPNESRTSVASLIPDKRQYRAAQQNYRKELDNLTKKKQQEQIDKKKFEIENERRRLKDISQRQNENESKIFEEMKIKVVRERHTMYQNAQISQQKKVYRVINEA